MHFKSFLTITLVLFTSILKDNSTKSKLASKNRPRGFMPFRIASWANYSSGIQRCQTIPLHLDWRPFISRYLDESNTLTTDYPKKVCYKISSIASGSTFQSQSELSFDFLSSNSWVDRNRRGMLKEQISNNANSYAYDDLNWRKAKGWTPLKINKQLMRRKMGFMFANKAWSIYLWTTAP